VVILGKIGPGIVTHPALARWSNHVLAVIEDQQPKIVTLRERTA
jgi:hypothetical protein